MQSAVPQVHISELADPPPPELLVLDVRENDEWAAGHVADSVHIPLMTLPQRLGELPAEREILVVCKVGARSAQATVFLQAQGWSAANLANGLMAWQLAGRPLVTDTGAPAFVA